MSEPISLPAVPYWFPLFRSSAKFTILDLKMIIYERGAKTIRLLFDSRMHVFHFLSKGTALL